MIMDLFTWSITTDHQQITDGKLEINPFSKGREILDSRREIIPSKAKQNRGLPLRWYYPDFISVGIRNHHPSLPTVQATVYPVHLLSTYTGNYRVESISATVEEDSDLGKKPD